MLKTKNILLLIPNVGFGGAERVFHDHSVAFSSSYNVIECVFNTEGDKAYTSENTFVSLDVPAGHNVFSKIYFFILRCLRLKKIKKKYKIDTSISHLEGADYINLLSKGRERVILCIHGSKMHDKNISGGIGWLRKKILMPLLYNRADKIVTVSRDINPELINGFGIKSDKVITINNFFDIDLIKQKGAEELDEPFSQIFHNNLIFITSGRLAIQKNHAPLLEVFSNVLQAGYSPKLFIIGDGELREDLLEYANKLGLVVSHAWEENRFKDESDVYFLGYQTNPFKFLAKANVFVFPSAWEGFPLALSEAMICGLPAASADCPTGPREILSPDIQPQVPLSIAENGEYGILMPMLIANSTLYKNSVKVWTDTLVELIQNPILRESYSTKSALRMKDFAKDKIIKSWIKVIDNV